MDKNKALQFATKGAIYLLNQIQRRGKFIYQRDMMGQPITGKYNLLRHCGCIWAISQVLNDCPELKDSKDLKMMQALGYMQAKVITSSDGALIDDKGFAKLGGSALLLLAIKENKTLYWDYLVAELWRGVNLFAYIKHGKGEIAHHKIRTITHEDSGFVSEYYNGELILALVAYGRYDIAMDLIDKMPLVGKDNQVIHDHWLLQAISQLYIDSQTLHPLQWMDRRFRLLEKAYFIAQAIMTEPAQYKGRSVRIACRVEGLVAFAKMLRYKSQGEPPLMKPDDLAYMEVSLNHAINDLLNELATFQYRGATDSIYGGFYDQGLFQIDYTQHAISAFYKYTQL